MLGSDTSLCKGNTLLLDAGEGTKYSWQDGSHNQFFKASKTGKYSVSVQNQLMCKTYDEIDVIFDTPPKANLGSDALVCSDSFPMNAGSGFRSYLWSTGSKDSTITASDAGRYWVTIGNSCGQARDSVNVYFIKDIFIPNVITLNDGDDLNAQFKIKGIGEDAAGQLVIYNRWGEKFLSDDHYKGDWPARNADIPSGIYYYQLTYVGCKTFKGWLHVITD